MISSSDSVLRVSPANTGPELVHPSSAMSVPSFVEIYESYLSFIWSTARHLGVEQSDLDDVVQDIFIVIHRRMHSIERPESLRSWIYSIVRRTVSTYRRSKRSKVGKVASGSQPPDVSYPAASTPQQQAEQSEQAQLLWGLLDKLDEPKREVFVLTELEDMTAPEIAAAIDVPLNTVYSRLRAARQELEAALQRHNARIKREPLCPT